MTDLAAAKAAARTAAKARRAAAHGLVDAAPALARLERWVAAQPGAVVAGYCAIGTELDPGPAFMRLATRHRLCLPVTLGPGAPLRFHAWEPGENLQPAGFGTRAPVGGDVVRPDLVVVPLLAFDREGGRMGYGAGHYDRTLAALKAEGAVHAVGLAYAAQEAPPLPQEPTDVRLDSVVTECETIQIVSGAPGAT